MPHGDKVDRTYVYSEIDCRALADAIANAPVVTPKDYPFLRPHECPIQCGVAQQTVNRAASNGHAAFGIDSVTGEYGKPEMRVEFRRAIDGWVFEVFVISRADARRIANWSDLNGRLLAEEKMTVADVAREMGLSTSTIDSQIRDRKIETETATCGRHRRKCRVILRANFESWKAGRNSTPDGPRTIVEWSAESAASAEEIKRAIDRGELTCTGPRRPARRIAPEEFHRWEAERNATTPDGDAPATHVPLAQAVAILERRNIGGSDCTRRSRLAAGGWAGIPRTFDVQRFRARDRRKGDRRQLQIHVPREFVDWIIAFE